MFALSVKGLPAAKKLLKTAEKLGSAIKGAQLNAKSRGDSAKTNAEILEYLAEGGRDFVTPDSETLRKIEETIAGHLEEGLERIKRGNLKKSEKAAATEIAAKAFKEGATVWNDKISQNISDGKTADGQVEELSEEYARQKQRRYGFTKPIGVATGQVRDNVAPGGRNIKLTR